MHYSRQSFAWRSCATVCHRNRPETFRRDAGSHQAWMAWSDCSPACRLHGADDSVCSAARPSRAAALMWSSLPAPMARSAVVAEAATNPLRVLERSKLLPLFDLVSSCLTFSSCCYSVSKKRNCIYISFYFFLFILWKKIANESNARIACFYEYAWTANWVNCNCRIAKNYSFGLIYENTRICTHTQTHIRARATDATVPTCVVFFYGPFKCVSCKYLTYFMF